MSRTELTGEPAIDLGRPGVIWLDGATVPVQTTGADRAVARLVEESLPRRRGPRRRNSRQSSPFESAREVPLAFGGPPSDFHGPDPAAAGPAATRRTLQVGGRRRKDAAAAIDRWYRREARERIEAVTWSEAGRLELEPKKVTIRDQKTRWGSCSTSGTLSFNWRLVIGPGHALRYVVIHELIHIRHHNHSRTFWAALSEAMPEWKASADWLRSNERLLTAYRPRI